MGSGKSFWSRRYDFPLFDGLPLWREACELVVGTSGAQSDSAADLLRVLDSATVARTSSSSAEAEPDLEAFAELLGYGDVRDRPPGMVCQFTADELRAAIRVWDVAVGLGIDGAHAFMERSRAAAYLDGSMG